MIFAIFIAIVLLLLAAFSMRRQVGNLRQLKSTAFMPSDDRRYQRNQAYRRLFTSVLLIVLAGLLAGAYLSGMERQAEQLGQKKVELDENDQPRIPTEHREFARFYSLYWIAVLLLLFVVVSLAIVDLWSTRRYAWKEMRRIQTENRAMLERDLAMHRQQKLNNRMRNLE